MIDKAHFQKFVDDMQSSDVAAIMLVMDKFGNVDMKPAGPLYAIAYCATNLNWFVNRMVEDSTAQKPPPPLVTKKT